MGDSPASAKQLLHASLSTYKGFIMINIITLFLGVIAFITVIIFIIIVLWYYQYYKYYVKGIHKLTGPSFIPVLGQALKLKPEPETMIYLLNACKEHNGLAKIIAGFRFALVVTDYKFAEFILSSNTITKKTFNYQFLRNWLGTGLILSDGPKWKSRRKIITPAFHFQILNQYITVFDSNSDILVKNLQNEVDVGCTSTNLYDHVPYCALDAICETAMSTKLNLQENKESIYMTSILMLTGIAMFRIADPFKHSDFLYKFFDLYRQEKKLLEVVHGHANSVIKKRREEIKLLDRDDKEADDIGKKKRIAFIDILMQARVDGKLLSDEDILEEVETFMFAGHDTTSEAMCFALYELSRNPDVQEKAFEEQRKIFLDDRSRQITMQDINEMKYLELIIKETLRLYPSVPSIGREVTEDFVYDGMTFKKGLNINLFFYGMHRNPKYFPDPENFNPERFSPENYLGNSPYSYIPFSAGPRNCIGQKFAYVEMKVVISKVLRNFRLDHCVRHVLKPIQKVTLYSLTGIPIQLKKRIW